MRPFISLLLLTLLLLPALALAKDAAPEAAPGEEADITTEKLPDEVALAAVPTPATAEVIVEPLRFLSFAYTWTEPVKSADDPASEITLGYLHPLPPADPGASPAAGETLRKNLLETFLDVCGVEIPVPETIGKDEASHALRTLFALKRSEGEEAQVEARTVSAEIPAHFSFHATCETRLAKGRYLSYLVDTWFYAPGAAHGLSYRGCTIFDLTTGARVPATALLRMDEKNSGKLFSIIEKKIRTARKIAPDAKLDEEGFFPENFMPTENVYLTDKEIGFYYNPYEISCYANGPDDVLIPLEELPADLFAENSPLLNFLPKK